MKKQGEIGKKVSDLTNFSVFTPIEPPDAGDFLFFPTGTKKGRRIAGPFILLVGHQGLEPWTKRLRVSCSTN